MLNKVSLIGHVGKAPENRFTGGGVAVSNFSLATTRRWKDKSGEQKELTTWWRIVAWDKLAEICGKHLHKGSKVYVEGEGEERKWKDREGQERTSFEVRAHVVTFLDPKPDGGSGKPRDSQDQRPEISDEDIPF